MLVLFSCIPTENLTNTNNEVERPINDNKEWTDTPFKEISPQFPNGNNAGVKYIKKNLRYPEKAIEKDIEGRVLVSFYVEKDGSLSDICIVRSPDSLLSREALRIVKGMPKWEPGKLGNEIVKTKCYMPIDFNIESYKETTNE